MADPAGDIEVLAQALVWLRVAYPDQIRGCDPDEVQEVLAQRPSFVVPEHYVHFLRRLGRGAGRLRRGTDVFYPDAAHTTEWAEETVRETPTGFRTKGKFFFGHHQGYQYYYFEEGSPAVFMYMEGEPAAERNYHTFLDFLWSGVRNAVVTGSRGFDFADYPAWPDQRPSDRGVFRHQHPDRSVRRVTPWQWRQGLPADAAHDVNVLAATLAALQLASPDEIRGCSEAELQEVLRATRSVVIPGHHLWFLRRMGRSAGRLWPNLEFHRPTPSPHVSGGPVRSGLLVASDEANDYVIDAHSGAVFALDRNAGTGAKVADSFLDFLWLGVRNAIIDSIANLRSRTEEREK
jgi:hypothetical protein